jgi:hypothetical protein
MRSLRPTKARPSSRGRFKLLGASVAVGAGAAAGGGGGGAAGGAAGGGTGWGRGGRAFGETALMASGALTRPKRATPGTGIALVAIACWIWLFDAVVFSDNASAAIPATSGAADDVPQNSM